jgi:gamma-glutamylcyclotransferase (GGCT)/AIG2-like uncharacterized protein YtfP
MTIEKNKNLIKEVLVAVYGSLRQGLHNHPVISESELMGQYETEPIYTMINCGSFPGLLKEGSTSVVMEVYKVDATTLVRLDNLEGYRGKGKNNFYNREKIDTPYGPAYTYFYNAESPLMRAKAIDTGDWVDFVRSKSLATLLQ